MTTFIEQHAVPPLIPEEENTKLVRPKTTCLSFILNRRNQLILFVLIFALVVPILIYYFLFHKQIAAAGINRTCAVNPTFRVPCGVVNTTKGVCLEHSCCYDDVTKTCFHYLPSYYAYIEKNENNHRPAVTKTPLGTNITQYLRLDVVQPNQNEVRITLKAVDDQNLSGFYQENYDQSNFTIKRCNNTKGEDGERGDTYLGVDISLPSTEKDRLVMSTCLGPLISSENYLEWTFYLGDHLFGFDRLHFSGNETIRKVFYRNGEDHTTMPVFMGYQNGTFSGLSIEYGGPLEIMVLPSRLIVVRAIGYQDISVVVYKGPTPKDVTQQLYGSEFQMPRWILEPHICRRGNQSLVTAVTDYIKFNLQSNVKFASDCFHENFYFMLLEAEPSDIEELKKAMRTARGDPRFILPIFPYVLPNATHSLYDRAEEHDILYMTTSKEDNSTEEVYMGSALGLDVAYPDFESANISFWLDDFMNMIQDRSEVDIGLFIKGYMFNNNWASDDTVTMSNVTDGLIYFDQNFADAMSKTLQWNATTPDNIQHIYTHNNYGRNQLNAYKDHIDPEAIIFSSVYQHHANVIAQVENMNGTWSNLKKTLQIVLTHSILAHPLISVPICGSTTFFEPIEQSELCIRWYIMAATMPIFKISSDVPLRDPHHLANGQAKNVALNAIGRRRLLSHYYYTLLMKQEPITRPMFYDFYENTTSFDLEEQYMVGDALLVAQTFLKDQPTVSVYLPHEAEGFYEFFGGERYDEMGWITLSAVATDWFMFIREGRIIPLYFEDHYSLAIALPKNETQQATGSLFLKSTFLHFSADYESITISNVKAAVDNCCDSSESCEVPLIFKEFSVYDLQGYQIAEIPTINLCDYTKDVICSFSEKTCI